MIGLSGLITPSLEEMSYIAGEMQRRGFTVPLLIGGATTSPAHTAVKIDPQYEGPVVYVKDASRAVGVCRQLVTPEMKPAYVAEVKADNVRRREQHAGKKVKGAQLTLGAGARQPAEDRLGELLAAGAAFPRQQGVQRRAAGARSRRTSTGCRSSMPGNSAASSRTCSTIPVRGEAARSLYKDAQEMLATILREHWLTARAVVGFFPCNAVDEEIEVYSDITRSRVLHRLHHLRQQKGKPSGQPHYALSDFIAPRDSGKVDYIGAFAVTAGIGIEKHLERFARGARRLQRHPAEVARGSSRGGIRRGAAPARAPRALGLLARRAAHQRAAHRRAVSRHPAGAGLSRLPGSHREGHVVADARRRARHRSQDHRELRDVSDGRGQRLVLRASGREVLRGRARSISTRCSTTRRARAGRRSKRASGSICEPGSARAGSARRSGVGLGLTGVTLTIVASRRTGDRQMSPTLRGNGHRRVLHLVRQLHGRRHDADRGELRGRTSDPENRAGRLESFNRHEAPAPGYFTLDAELRQRLRDVAKRARGNRSATGRTESERFSRMRISLCATLRAIRAARCGHRPRDSRDGWNR